VRPERSCPGTDYDQLDVRGSVQVDGTHLQIRVNYAPAEGDQFIIINNDGADPVVGFFDDLPEGAVFTADPPNPVKFHITYRGGSDNNDVVLTATNLALGDAIPFVLADNGNRRVDTNECLT